MSAWGARLRRETQRRLELQRALQAALSVIDSSRDAIVVVGKRGDLTPSTLETLRSHWRSLGEISKALAKKNDVRAQARQLAVIQAHLYLLGASNGDPQEVGERLATISGLLNSTAISLLVATRKEAT